MGLSLLMIMMKLKLVMLLACLVLPCYTAADKNTLPNLVMILQDDLGYYDNAFNGNQAAANRTANVTRLANEGIILTSHYVFYWCSPTRRSFLSGRLPIHHGEMLSGDQDDDLDLRWNIISQKLDPKGYYSYWFGKGHTGYMSMHHLPTHRGFKNWTGFLTGMQSYTSNQRWKDGAPYNGTEYSTNLFGDDALSIVNDHDTSIPLFLYLPWQAVHDPYDPVPGWSGDVYHGMLWASDCYVGELRSKLEEKGMYDNTLIVYSADNGGRGNGINYPLRGEKRTNYEGGMRVAAFVSGGLIPTALRGTKNDIRMHIVDWYATFCYLAGVDAKDDPPVPPLPVDPTNPNKDIYGNQSWPSVDGKNVWDGLINPNKYNVTSFHPTIVLSKEVIIVGTKKLLVSQRGNTGQSFDKFENQWQHPNGTWFAPSDWEQTCGFPVYERDKNVPPKKMTPCLFDLSVDKNETNDLSQTQRETMLELWTMLNNTWLTYYHARSPADKLGPCNVECARKYWHGYDGPKNKATQGPICGVPGCSAINMARTQL